MADTKHAPQEGYSREMDGTAHEQTYEGFLHFTTVGVFFALGCVAGLAVGVIRHAWFSVVLGIIVVHVSAAIGLFAPSLKWKPVAAALALMIAMLLFYG